MLQPGTELKRGYHIERVLGQGGMGAVYLAHQSSLGRRVAIKETIIAVTDENDRAAVMASFKKEAEILASLEHPNLVDVKDYFEENGSHFLVMSYIDGATLEEVVSGASEPPPVSQVLGWVDQICEVLEFLHQHRPPVLVRDLKPSNVMVDAQGRIKLIDFGIARVEEQGQQTATFLRGAGTVGFAPVEQFGGSSTDARSDIYALGATIYCLLTRSVPPWSMQLATGEVQLSPPSRTNPSVPPALDALVMRAMALKREDRFPTVAEMRQALRTIAPMGVASPPLPTADVGHRFCTDCGTTLVPAAHGCHRCGKPRDSGGFAPPQPPSGGFAQAPSGGFSQAPAGSAQPRTGGVVQAPSGGFGEPPSGGFAQPPAASSPPGPTGASTTHLPSHEAAALPPPPLAFPKTQAASLMPPQTPPWHSAANNAQVPASSSAMKGFHIPDGMPLDPVRTQPRRKPWWMIGLAILVLLAVGRLFQASQDPHRPDVVASGTVLPPPQTTPTPATPTPVHIGVEMVPLNATLRARIGYSGTYGVLVARVLPNSPASRASLYPWDLITSVDGTPVMGVGDVQRLVQSHQRGQWVHLEVWSHGTTRVVNVAPE